MKDTERYSRLFTTLSSQIVGYFSHFGAEQVKKVFSNMDRDGSGSVDYGEFVQFLSKHAD